MVASLWSGTWFASQLPLNQIEATASNVRKLRYVIGCVKTRSSPASMAAADVCRLMIAVTSNVSRKQ